MSLFRELFLMVALGTMAFSVYGSDQALSDEPELKKFHLADFDGTADDAVLLGQWKTIAQRWPGSVSLRLDPGSSNSSSGRSLRVDYVLPPSADSVDLPETGGEFAVSLDLRSLAAADYDHLRFRVKGDPAEGFNPEFEVQFHGPEPAGSGMKEVGSFMVSGITDQWKQVVVPLNYMIGIKDWRQLSAFVISFPPRAMRVRKGAYWVDDIALIKTGKPGPGTADRVVAEKKKDWEDALGGEAAARLKLRERLAGWPATPLVDGKTLPAGERAFLYRIARDTWRGLDALTDKLHGLPLDRVHFGKGSVNLSDSKIGDYTSVTNIGFYFLAMVAAHELGFVARKQALERLAVTLATLESLETYRGFYFNYYNTTTLERTSNFISFVDSSWLTAGLIVVRQVFPELASRCTRLIEHENYGFFYDAGHKLMSHGYYVNMALRSSIHYGVLFAESRIGSLIAIGKGDVPEEHWFRMARTLPAEFGWQSLPPLHRTERSENGFRWIGGYYQWREYRYVPSWGGSLFEALMPSLVLDEVRHAPTSLGYNGKIHTDIQRVYALGSLGYPVWGMSPSSTPGADRYAEYGVKVLGAAGYGGGVVTPHAAVLAVLTEPSEAVANLRKLIELYPIYGDFGFYDAVNPVTGEVAYNYLSLNQAMILVALANHLADHAVQKRFAADPIVQRVLPLIGFEKFVDDEPRP